MATQYVEQKASTSQGEWDRCVGIQCPTTSLVRHQTTSPPLVHGAQRLCIPTDVRMSCEVRTTT